MTRRFMNVLRGYRGEAAKNKYLDRLRGLGQGENVGGRGGRPASKALYVRPFGQNMGSNMYLKCSALSTSFTALNAYSEVAGRYKETISGDDIGVKIKGFTPARVVRRTKDATGTPETSKLTGLRYLKYTATSVSAPFGRKGTTAETMGAAFQDIYAQIPGTFSVSLIEERI
jgi:hypothetical protein